MKPVQPTVRQEDDRLLTGRGRFVDDLPWQQYCAGLVIRSPYPHALIEKIDVEAAKNAPGVKLILTAEDLRADGLGTLPCVSSFPGAEDPPIIKPLRPVLATERVRHVGEPVVFVVADSAENAAAAADLIDIDYRELASNSNVEKAQTTGAQIWREAEHNLCYDFSRGDRQDVDRLLEKSRHVTSIKVHHPRMAITPIEPRAAGARYDSDAGQWVLEVQSQGVHMIRKVLAEDVLHMAPEKLKVITGDVGGSFGMKIFPYPEYALVLIAAQKIAHAVKWTASRTESFLSDAHGRARVDYARIGFDENNNITAYQSESHSDLGAYLSYVAPSIASVYAYTVVGHTYRIPCLHFRNLGLFTNAAPTDAFRGAGKPETVCTLEQLLDKAAFELGVDRLELRRKNLVRSQELPYLMLNGQTIDSGDFSALLERAAELSDWHHFPERRKAAQRRGFLRGIGLGMYMHSTGGSISEVSEVRLARSGKVDVYTGTQTGGQGHATTLAGLVAGELEIESVKVRVIQGNTEKIATGGGTGGSSLVAIAGNTVVRAARIMLQNTRQSVAELLEVSVDNIAYHKGIFSIPGTDRHLTLSEVAAMLDRIPEDQPGCLGQAQFEGINTTHPSGAYVAELECDPETGQIQVIQLVGVDDIGRVLFADLADGQLHGSWAQSVGTSLMESIEFDSEDRGQVLSGSLMDYQLPRARDLPFLKLDKLPTLCTTNALGAKGVGEAASLGAPGAIGNALSDMLTRGDDFVVVKPPATPFAVWTLLQKKPG